MDFLPTDVNGLPLHPLVVHVAVVLIPLCGVLALFMILIPRFSYRFGPLVLVLAWLGAGGAWVAKESGEVFRREVEEVSRLHVESGDLLPYFAAAQAALITLLWIADRRGGRGVFGVLIALLTLLTVAAAGYWTYRTGESGASSVWGG